MNSFCLKLNVHEDYYFCAIENYYKHSNKNTLVKSSYYDLSRCVNNVNIARNKALVIKEH